MRFSRFIAALSLTVLTSISLPLFANEPELARQTGRINGSWVVDVTLVASPRFSALQTFDFGGTFAETSDLLAQGGEGPGHGAWQKFDDMYVATFELFIFEPDGTPAGRIRVRENVNLVDENHFTGFSVADLILPDGTVIENIDNGPLSGTRVGVRPVRPEEMNSTPTVVHRGRRAW